MQQELTAQPPVNTVASTSEANHCANCGEAMHGAYCYRCGQATRHFIKFFPSVVREIIEDTLDVDGRFGRTLFTILFRPGRVTRDFLGGRRVHYTPPFRLYLFTSLVAFLLLNLEVSEIRRDFEDNVTQNAQTQVSEAATNEQIIADTTNLEAASDEPADDDQSAEAPEDDDEGFTIRFNDQAWHPTENPVAVSWLPGGINAFLNRSIGNIEKNGPRIEENPGLLIGKVVQLLPQTLFILLPIFALILKFFYMFSKRYYMEHLIFSVHLHTFTLLILIAAALTGMLQSRLPDSMEIVTDIIQMLLLLWALIYTFIAQKRVYRQGWFFTFIKFNLVYFTYSILQIFAIVIVVVIGAATL